MVGRILLLLTFVLTPKRMARWLEAACELDDTRLRHTMESICYRDQSELDW